MLSVEEAQSLVLSPLAPIGAETVPLAQALGRVIAESAIARTSHPPADVSAMDGWAVRASDGSPLTQIGESSAGHPFEGSVGPGQAVRIFTGAVMPEGADSVAIQEDCVADGAKVTLNVAAITGQHVRRQGQDFAVGQALLEPGKQLSARDIALLAAMNRPWVSVRRRPRVAVLSTGDELALPGEPIPAGGLPSSNGLSSTLAAETAIGERRRSVATFPPERRSTASRKRVKSPSSLAVRASGLPTGVSRRRRFPYSALNAIQRKMNWASRSGGVLLPAFLDLRSHDRAR